MEYIDKELKNRFSKQQLPNDEFDAEGLWDNIAAALEVEAKPEWYENRKNQSLLALLLLFSFGAMTFCYFSPVENKEKNTPDFTINQAITKSEKITATATLKSSKSNAIGSKTATNNNLISDVNTSPNNSPKPVEKVANMSTKKKYFTTLSDASGTTPVQSIHKTNQTPNIPNKHKFVDRENEVIPATSITSEAKLKEKMPFINSPIDAKMLPTLDLKLLSTEKNEVLKPIGSMADIETLSPKQNNNLIWQIGIYGGNNRIGLSFEDTNSQGIATTKNETEMGEWGSTIGLETSLLYKNRYLVHTGLERHNLWSKFSYTQVSNIQVLKENQLLKIRIDEMTGDTLAKIYGDTLVNAVSTRNVTHYNKYQTWSIPLEVGLQIKQKRLILGLTAGVVFNFTRHQEGKTIGNATDIVSFTNENGLLESFNLGFRLSPFLAYHLSDNLAITLQPKWTWMKSDALNTDNLQVKLQQLNVNVGLRYALGK